MNGEMKALPGYGMTDNRYRRFPLILYSWGVTDLTDEVGKVQFLGMLEKYAVLIDSMTRAY
ncbi:MAG TPA: hypothetical protein PKD12_09745 [Nitrospira sp.]|nr:hypothetical protein [Nitrospira sp.]